MSLALMDIDDNFVYKTVIFAMIVTLVFPMAFTIFVPTADTENLRSVQEDLNDEYYNFTGSKATSESVWVLSGIYTPYTGGAYGYTPDGWLYGERIVNYSPSQYAGGQEGYTVVRDDRGYYTYGYTEAGETKGLPSGQPDIRLGDTYTAVTFDVNQTSDVFFTSDGKVYVGDNYYYNYTGYRYSFAPLSDYYVKNVDGDAVKVVANSTSLSLIWYQYTSYSGLAGQLVLTGSDSGLAYITSAQIVNAFNATTSTATFTMTFNGVEMHVSIRLNAYYLAAGETIEECYNRGHWSVIVSSTSTDVNSLMSTDYSFNINNIFNTLVDLLTFDLSDYGLTGWMATLASLVVILPLYAALIAVGLACWPVLIMAGTMAAIQSLGFFNLL